MGNAAIAVRAMAKGTFVPWPRFSRSHRLHFV
jgi:hypothetical protein